MTRFILASAAGLLAAALLGGCARIQPPATRSPETPASAPSVDASGAPQGWGSSEVWVVPSEAGVDPTGFVSGVDNPYWPLVPGATWVYQAGTDEGTETIEVAVLDEPKQVMGIECVVVRDTVTLDGELVEDTFDWYAQDEVGNVWYMGEDVKNYEGGKLVDTKGSWKAGTDGAQPGIKMWAAPQIGLPAYYQELYRGQAEDLAKDLAFDGTAAVPFGEYSDLLVVEEWTPLDPEFVERKYYARGVGAVKEEMIRGGTEVVELIGYSTP